MSDNVSVVTTSGTDDVSLSFTESISVVGVLSPITINDVSVEVSQLDNSVNVNVTDSVSDVSVLCEEVVQPINVAVTEEVDDVNVEVSTGSALWTSSFDTVSRNLSSYPYIINYSGTTISSIVFNLGLTSVTKTFNYNSGNLTSVVLSGDTPSGISLTKTLFYVGGKVSSITYS